MTNSNLPRYSRPAHSALYNAIKGLIFMGDRYACKVSHLSNDENDSNLKINNEKRLKDILFREIMAAYNKRIDEYDLLWNKLYGARINDFYILKFKFISDKNREYSGKYSVFPRTFVCSNKECGDFKSLNKEEWEDFDPNKCKDYPSCNGKYEQVSILMFCEQCGLITPFYYPCGEHGLDNIKLIRDKKDSLSTWKVVCKKCNDEHKKDPVDIFRFRCNHKEYGEIICEKPSEKFKPLTIREGGVYTSNVITVVDIPHTNYIDIDNLEYILLGLYLDKFDQISQKGKTDLKRINRNYQLYNSIIENSDVDALDAMKDLLDELQEFMEKLNIITEQIKNNYLNTNLEKINEYFAVKGLFEEIRSENEYERVSYDSYVESCDDLIKKENYENLKKDFKIENIIYISNINLISSAIGIINGINRFYDDKFVPHFNPIWEDERSKEKILAYSYPFETEGILIDLDKLQVCKWLIQNGFLKVNIPKNPKEASEILLKIEENSLPYEKLKILIHTLSHTLIRRSSLYTGLDSDSCSELLFVNAASFLIYSTSNIRTGGFSSVFEYSLTNWFNDIKLDINDCTFDPICIFEKGACSSCIYLQEYVCSEFNRDLDRATLIGKRDYEFGYWK